MKQSGDDDKQTTREMQMAALRADMAKAIPLKQLVQHDLSLGVDPKWIAVKYGYLGVTLERVEKFKAALDAQTEARAVRAAARSGGV